MRTKPISPEEARQRLQRAVARPDGNESWVTDLPEDELPKDEEDTRAIVFPKKKGDA